MALRSLKKRTRAKKDAGIYEYFNPKSVNKEVLAFYIAYKDEEGKSIKIKTDAKTPNDARKILQQKKDSLLEMRIQVSKNKQDISRTIILKRITLDELATLFFKNRDTKNNTKDEQAYNNRIGTLSYIKKSQKRTTLKISKDKLPLIGNIKVSQIKEENLVKLKHTLLKYYAPKTVNETFNLLSAIFNEGIKPKNIWCTNNPVVDFEIKRVQETHETGRILSNNELDILFNTLENGNIDFELLAHPTLFLFAKVLYYTGVRPAGAIAIRIQDIDFNEKKIHLKALKGGTSYYQSVNDDLLDILKEWINKYDLKYNNYIFYPKQTFNNAKTEEEKIKAKQKHVIYESLNNPARKYFDKLFNQDIPVQDEKHRASFYSLRRTAGTKIYKAKGIVHAMIFLNHTSVKTTMKYLNVKSDMEDISDIL